MDARERELADNILRNSGLLTPDAELARKRLDERLAGSGLSVEGVPTRVLPGEVGAHRSLRGTVIGTRGFDALLEKIARNTGEQEASAAGAAGATLLDPSGLPPKVQVQPSQTDSMAELGTASFEPSDLSAAVAVTSLAASSAGGTEVRFNKPGIIYVGSGAMGVYWARALGAKINSKWAPLLAGMRLAYHPQAAIFFGTNSVGSVAVSGVLTLAFYEMPPNYQKKRDAWRKWHKQIGEWTEGSGDSSATGALLQALSTGGTNGTDVTLGTFSDAGAGTQIFKAATNFPVGGASSKGSVIVNASNANTDSVWVAETAALAVASNNGVYQGGQDMHSRAVAEKLFMLANSGTQVLGARYRS